MTKRFLYAAQLLVFLVVLSVLLIPGNSAQAACGASVSSCKTCHEVRGEMPVSAAGAWHIDHVFGDFCEACHGGVVSSMDSAGAHAGLRQPLADAKSSCGSCHVVDLAEKAEVYGAVLTEGSGDNRSGSSGGTVSQPVLLNAEQVPEKDLIDYNRMLLVFQGLEKKPLNTVFILLNILALLLLFYLIWKYDLQQIVAAASLETKSGDDLISDKDMDCRDCILGLPGGEKVLKRLASGFAGDGEGEIK